MGGAIRCIGLESASSRPSGRRIAPRMGGGTGRAGKTAFPHMPEITRANVTTTLDGRSLRSERRQYGGCIGISVVTAEKATVSHPTPDCHLWFGSAAWRP